MSAPRASTSRAAADLGVVGGGVVVAGGRVRAAVPVVGFTVVGGGVPVVALGGGIVVGLKMCRERTPVTRV